MNVENIIEKKKEESIASYWDYITVYLTFMYFMQSRVTRESVICYISQTFTAYIFLGIK